MSLSTTTSGIQDIIGSDVRKWMEIAFFVIASGVISFLGSIANVMVIVVFFKQGFSDSINISLLGLAVADLGSLLTLVWMSICFNPLFRYSGISFESIDIQYITAGWPHVCFARITSWITAFITLERCLCIATPHRVKQFLTPKRTLVIILLIYLFLFLSVAPVYYALRIGPHFDDSRNKTLDGLVYADDGTAVENVSFAISVFAQLSSCACVIICTVVLIINLTRKSQWRNTSLETSSAKPTMSNRDKRVVLMVASISCIFIACFLPSAINLILMLHFSPNYSIVGPYQNSFQVSWSILNTLEATNSSVSVLVYYKMSSKFRLVFRETFCITRSTGTYRRG
ncbi:tachykinin-like peptides receptor 86C [Physella acuta]|uniref:tachykinin-like peptides receptor 86C n=1 Tax=Physella acuta TaxID=109671 RepID=UPI0027DD249B|nr:tachykinin-like peptides receptor 86C [Physella acuta]